MADAGYKHGQDATGAKCLLLLPANYLRKAKERECCKENIKEADLIEIVKAAICRQGYGRRRFKKTLEDSERR